MMNLVHQTDDRGHYELPFDDWRIQVVVQLKRIADALAPQQHPEPLREALLEVLTHLATKASNFADERYWSDLADGLEAGDIDTEELRRHRPSRPLPDAPGVSPDAEAFPFPIKYQNGQPWIENSGSDWRIYLKVPVTLIKDPDSSWSTGPARNSFEVEKDTATQLVAVVGSETSEPLDLVAALKARGLL